MNRAQRKFLEKSQKRKAAQADTRRREWAKNIEMLNGAYLKETKIPASKALLCHEKVADPENPNKITDKYWFEHHEKRVKIVDTHPDIEYLFSLVAGFVNAWDASNKEEDLKATIDGNILDGVDMMREFIKKYEDIVETEIEEEYVKR